MNKRTFALFSKGSMVPSFCDKKISHVDILVDDGLQYTVFSFSSKKFGYYITVFDSKDGLEKMYLNKGYKVIDCSNIRYKYEFKPRFRILNCVEVAKYFLGINDFFVFTPFQLYKKLLKLNCKEIKGKNNGRIIKQSSKKGCKRRASTIKQA